MINALGLDSVRKASQDEGMKVIDAMREDAGDLDVRAKVEGGEFAPVIVREADHMDADLIVMGCRGLSAMEGFFVGSVSAKVISLTKRPLLLVRDKIPAGAMRVGICVDYSDYAHAAAEFVVNQREFFGKDAVFEVINVSETEETFHQAVEPVMTVFEDAGVPAERVHLKGKVGDAICNYAGEGKLDMLVIGSHGYGNFRAAFMGSTAMRITAGCEVPLLVLKA